MELLRRSLQERIGSSPRVKLGEFCNWPTTQKNEDVLSVWPRSVAEVQTVIRAAHGMKLRIRCAGAGFSWSPLYADTGHVVLHTAAVKSDYTNGEQIAMKETADGPMISVMAGVTIDTFKEFQLQHNVCVPCDVSFTAATVGGVIATANHAVGRSQKTFAEHIIKMRIVDSHGVVRTFTNDNEDMMKSVRCNVGLFGVVIDVTLSTSPMYMVETQTDFTPLSELFYDAVQFKSLVEKNWSVEIVWFPFNGMLILDGIQTTLKRTVSKDDWNPGEDRLLIRTLNKVDKPLNSSQGARRCRWNNVADWLPQTGVLDVDDMIRHHGYYTPKFLKRGFQILREEIEKEGTSITQEITHAVHWRDQDLAVPTLQFEVTRDVDEKFSNLLRSIHHLIEKIREEATRGRFPINLAFRLKFTGPSDHTFLSPSVVSSDQSGGGGTACVMEISSLPGTPGVDECFLNIARTWLGYGRALPNIGKTWTFIDGIDEHFQKEYGENLKKFLYMLDKSDTDPDGLFLNYRLQHLFFPELNDRRQRFLIETEKVYEMAMSEDQGCLCSVS